MITALTFLVWSIQWKITNKKQGIDDVEILIILTTFIVSSLTDIALLAFVAGL